jgi:outer membrane protein assembly factor BamB
MGGLLKRLVMVGMLVGVAFSASGCWLENGWLGNSTFDNTLETTLSDSNVGSLTTQWSTAPGDQGPVVTDGSSVYQLSFAGAPYVTSYNASNGTVNWTDQLSNDGGWFPLLYSPALGNLVLGGNGLVFVDLTHVSGPNEEAHSEVVAINAASGGPPVWTDTYMSDPYFVGPPILAALPTASGGPFQPALLVSVDPNPQMMFPGAVYALNPSTGANLWTSGAGYFDTSASVGNGTAYLGGSDGDLYGIDLANGAVDWSVPVDTKEPRIIQ